MIRASYILRRLSLPAVGLFAMLWAIARAHVQAVTIDEAMTYSNFVYSPGPSYWTPHANNHVLNSMLIRLFMTIFGASHVTLRSGALLGAAIYILASFLLSTLIARDIFLRLSLFLCLVYNPFLFDFMVAARGYSLALGFLACAIGVIALRLRPEIIASPSSLLVCCGLSSAFAALSLASNFSFVFVDSAALLVLYLWARWSGSARRSLVLACTLPGLLVGAVLVGSVLIKWPGGQLTYGATSLSETFGSIAEASLYEPSPYVVNPLFYKAVISLSGLILPFLAIMCVWRLVLLLSARSHSRTAESRWLIAFGAAVASIIILTLAAHWLAFRFFQILLPKDRTAIYFVVLITLLAGILAAVPAASRFGNISRHGLTFALFILGVFFVLCLRLNYFKEWKWDSDVDKVYSVLAYYNRTCGLKDIATNWRYDASLNFYREISGRETIFEFQSTRVYPLGKRAYVLYYPEDQGFIAERGLKVVYRGESDATVVIDPSVGACETDLPRDSIH